MQSPYCNKSVNAVALFNLVKGYHPKYDAKALNREKLFPKLFPKVPYKEQKLRYAATDLAKALENFLSHQAFLEERTTVNAFLLKAYAKRGLHKYFGQTLQNTQGELQKQSLRDANYFLQAYHFEEEKFNFSPISTKEATGILKQIMHDLDQFYMANKLKYCCEVFNYLNVYKNNILIDDQQPLLLQELLNHLEQNPPSEASPAVVLYYQILLTLIDGDNETHYTTLTEYLQTYKTAFTPQEMHNMYIYARNYCIKKLNTGSDTYTRKLFELHEELLESKIIMHRGYLIQSDYKNITSIGLWLKEWDFVENFINDYKKYLQPEERKNAYLFNTAHYHFAKKEFQKTLEMLNQVEFTHTYYHTDTKILIVKCYYELEEVIPLFNIIDTFKAYLRKNKLVSNAIREVYATFLSVVKKMTRMKMGSRQSIDSLRKEIAKTYLGSNSEWLMEKVNELEEQLEKRKW
ncbi:MAG: hypothetical protein ACPGXL_08445 [Chitinophagales bacterium]